MTERRVLALDLSANLIGYSVVDEGPTFLYAGHFSLPTRRETKAGKEDRALWNLRRHAALATDVKKLVADWLPGILAYEYPDKPRTYFSGGSKGREFHAMQGLGLAEGLLLALAATIVYPPLTVTAISTSEAKLMVTGLVGASKDRVRADLAHKWGWLIAASDTVSDDESDSMAVALAALELARMPNEVRADFRRRAAGNGKRSSTATKLARAVVAAQR